MKEEMIEEILSLNPHLSREGLEGCTLEVLAELLNIARIAKKMGLLK